MGEPKLEQVGEVIAFFARPSVAVLQLSGSIAVGQTLYIKGHTTDLHVQVESLQVDHQPVQDARPGQSVGLKVSDRCRKHDIVYRVAG